MPNSPPAKRSAPCPGSALYYHTTNVRPSWANTYNAVAQIGSHIFYSPN